MFIESNPINPVFEVATSWHTVIHFLSVFPGIIADPDSVIHCQFSNISRTKIERSPHINLSGTGNSPVSEGLYNEVEAAEDARPREESDPKGDVAEDLAVAEEAGAA